MVLSGATAIARRPRRLFKGDYLHLIKLVSTLRDVDAISTALLDGGVYPIVGLVSLLQVLQTKNSLPDGTRDLPLLGPINSPSSNGAIPAT